MAYEGEKPIHHGFIAPSAIESSIGYIKSIGIADLDDNDSVDEFFITVWKVIKDEWAGIFNCNENNKLLDKVGIVSLTEFLVKELRSRSLNKYSKFSLADPDKVSEHTADILSGMSPDFWTSDWKSTSYDTRAGRDQIVANIEKMYGNFGDGRPWYDRLDVLAK